MVTKKPYKMATTKPYKVGPKKSFKKEEEGESILLHYILLAICTLCLIAFSWRILSYRVPVAYVIPVVLTSFALFFEILYITCLRGMLDQE
jgi:hypothetical protein